MRTFVYDGTGEAFLYVTGAGVLYDASNRPLGMVQDEQVVTGGRFARRLVRRRVFVGRGRLPARVRQGCEGAGGARAAQNKATRLQTQPTPFTPAPTSRPAYQTYSQLAVVAANLSNLQQRSKSVISFDLSDEQRQIQALARQFAREVVIPNAAQYDRDESFPADIVAQAHELGLLNVIVPEAVGGLGLGMMEEVVHRRRTRLRLHGYLHDFDGLRTRHHAHFDSRKRRAKGKVFGAAAGRPQARRLRLVRSRQRLGRRRDEDARGVRRRRGRL